MSMPAAKRAEAFAPTPSSTARPGGTNQPTDMELTMETNIIARPSGANKSPFARMDPYQLLEAAKTLVAAQQIAALSHTAAHMVQADDQDALIKWAESRMEAISDEIFELLQEFDRRTDLNADGQAWRDTAVAITHDIVRKSLWDVSVRRVA